VLNIRILEYICELTLGDSLHRKFLRDPDRRLSPGSTNRSLLARILLMCFDDSTMPNLNYFQRFVGERSLDGTVKKEHL